MTFRAVSSVGRAGPLQGSGRRFEPGTAHIDDSLGGEERIYSGPAEVDAGETVALTEVPLRLTETFPDGTALAVDDDGAEFVVELEAFRGCPKLPD